MTIIFEKMFCAAMQVSSINNAEKTNDNVARDNQTKMTWPKKDQSFHVIDVSTYFENEILDNRRGSIGHQARAFDTRQQ